MSPGQERSPRPPTRDVSPAASTLCLQREVVHAPGQVAAIGRLLQTPDAGTGDRGRQIRIQKRGGRVLLKQPGQFPGEAGFFFGGGEPPPKVCQPRKNRGGLSTGDPQGGLAPPTR